MVLESVLLKFLLILIVLFLVPKLLYRYTKIPSPLIEVLLGLGLGMLFPKFFFADDMIQVLATLGIITLFVVSGMEVDTKFIRKNGLFFIESLFMHFILFFLVGLGVHALFGLQYQLSFLVSIALTTPSASYILSWVKHSKKHVKWIEAKALSAEVLGLALMVILVRLDRPLHLLLVLSVLALIIFLLPVALRFLYRKFFSKLVGTEFSFIFVVAIISAYLTEFIGIHFLVGAFIAGVVARRFVQNIVKDKEYASISHIEGKNIISSFGFFALTFVPFYFYSVGLHMALADMTLIAFAIAAGLCIVLLLLRSGLMFLHRRFRLKESPLASARISVVVMPTLVFTFVLAELLYSQFGISSQLFTVLMVYGVFTAIFSLVLARRVHA
ncbi:MAG: cation:proton antiporter [archaeon]